MSRVTEIRYVGYGVPDLEAERAFYRDNWGLREVAASATAWSISQPRAATSSMSSACASCRREADRRDRARGRQAATDVDALARQGDGRRLRDRLRAAGTRQLGGGYGFRFF